MGWQDRDYNQSGYGGAGHPVRSILNGSVPLGTWFGIRVRVHASLIIFIVAVVLLDYSRSYPLDLRLKSMTVLFAIVLLHEFGHCFAARSVGGVAEDILMWPLGGLAYAQPPHRPWPTFVTVAGGPLVNVVICVITAALLYFGAQLRVSLNPWNPMPTSVGDAFYTIPFWRATSSWIWLTFAVSYMLLLFNLLPIFPLDGGQLLQSILWPKMGYRRSMLFACNTGIGGAVLMGAVGLFTLNFLLLFLAINGFMVCYQRRLALREMGPGSWGDEPEMDFSASLRTERKAKHLSRRAIRRAQKLAAREQAEQAKLDEILAKVSAQGMQSLTWRERRTLKKATEHQRQRDLELARRRDW